MRKIGIDKDFLEKYYVQEGMNLGQISDLLGVHRQTIANKLKIFSIPIRQVQHKKKTKKMKKIKPAPLYRNKDDFDKRYSELKSLDLVAEHYGVSISTIVDWKLRHEIPTIHAYSHRGAKLKKDKEQDKPYTSKVRLLIMYVHRKHSITYLSKLWGVSLPTLRKWLRKYKIPIRTQEENLQARSFHRSKKGEVLPKNVTKTNVINTVKLVVNMQKLSKKALRLIRETVGCCQACGYFEVLDVHHINYNAKDNRPENHVVLCPNCHAKVHRLNANVFDLVPDYQPWSYHGAK